MTCIAICGDSASGKSRLATLLGAVLYGSDVLVLECDRYHYWERNDPRWQQFTQLNPVANNIALLEKDVKALKAGEVIYRSEYDHRTGTFTEPKQLSPKPHLIVCGLHTLMCDPSIFDLTIFLDPVQELKTRWKIERDTRFRGYSVEQVLAQIERRKPDYDLYIAPLKAKADVVVKKYEVDGKLCSSIDFKRDIGTFFYNVLAEIL